MASTHVLHMVADEPRMHPPNCRLTRAGIMADRHHERTLGATTRIVIRAFTTPVNAAMEEEEIEKRRENGALHFRNLVLPPASPASGIMV